MASFRKHGRPRGVINAASASTRTCYNGPNFSALMLTEQTPKTFHLFHVYNFSEKKSMSEVIEVDVTSRRPFFNEFTRSHGRGEKRRTEEYVVCNLCVCVPSRLVVCGTFCSEDNHLEFAAKGSIQIGLAVFLASHHFISQSIS